MDRKKFGAVWDEAVGQLENDVRILKTQQQTITINLKDLESRRDKISSDIAELEKKHSGVLAKHKSEIDSMMTSAQEKLTRANIKESEASGKLTELNQKIKEADDLIKSNNGLKKNLEILTMEAQNKVSKLKVFIASTTEFLETL